ncbi:MAG TPA: urease accessory protein UreD [Verrucomicrobiae bacterium]|nr:urease accessory protein UreD [Verrucomicrobiae bacterium]
MPETVPPRLVPESGQASAEVNVVAGQSTVTSARATSPLKLLTPRARGQSVWLYASSYGGGMVAGDRTSFRLELGRDARCFAGTQASTKIYRNAGLRPCSHSMKGTLAPGSLLVYAPDPVQCFRESSYTQRQEFRMEPGSGLVLVDACCSGRAARGERWAFSRYQSRNELFVGDERLLVDSLLLDPADGPLDGRHRLGRFNCLALVLVIGAPLREFAKRLLEEIEAMPVPRQAPLLLSASPARDGVILRVAGERVEEVGRAIRERLSFVRDLLGDDPWARKW